MLTNMKKFFLFVLTLLFINIVNAESYYIKDVNYKITGITRQYALETKVKIDRKKIFGSEDELRKYVKHIYRPECYDEALEYELRFQKDGIHYEIGNPQCTPFLPEKIKIVSVLSEKECLEWLIKNNKGE